MSSDIGENKKKRMKNPEPGIKTRKNKDEFITRIVGERFVSWE